jgi:alkaline phosphatase
MLSKRAGIGWIYTGHTGEDLFLYAYGPNKPAGLIQNTDIAKITAQSLGFDLTETSRKLFVEAGAAFATLGASTRLDASDPDSPVLIVEKALRRATLPINGSQLQTGKSVHSLPGVVVQVPKTGQVFVPQTAVDILKESGW